ncbi:MAG: hypothetical protein EOP83_01710 [Verrucomicrobiaceae bacterium]|nr:MAG: hypothetical protein EOP83_01710 [Verrucomicrobiaceae bacterium]
MTPFILGTLFVLITAVLDFALWGMLFADREKDEMMKFSLCRGGTQAGVTFANNKLLGYGHHKWGPPTFQMEFWAVSVPGATAFFVKAPICPGDDIDDFIEKRDAEELRAASDTNGVQNALRQGYDAAEAERATRGSVPYETSLDDGYQG